MAGPSRKRKSKRSKKKDPQAELLAAVLADLDRNPRPERHHETATEKLPAVKPIAAARSRRTRKKTRADQAAKHPKRRQAMKAGKRKSRLKK